MSERDDQREQRREDKSGSSQDPFVPEAPPTRPGNKCDPSQLIPDQVFYDPEGCPVPTPPPDELPDPLAFGNPLTVRDCDDLPGGNIGDPSTVAADHFVERVYFQSLTDINTAQLTLIAGLSDEAIETVKDPITPAEDLVPLLQLEIYQAEELVVARDAAIASVTQLAITLALNSLNCVWQNVEQVAECPPGALLTADAPAGQESRVNNPVVVAAGTISSQISQAAADEQALNLAQSRLRCLWGNTLQEVNCVDDLGFAEDVPNDVDPVGLAARVRVGSVTVLANTIYSDVSQEDADNLALAQAIGALDCFYINDAQAATCPPDEDGVAAAVDPLPAGADVSKGEQGNPTSVPQGYVETSTNTGDANDLARELALQALNCYWTNDAVTAECPVEVDDDGNEFPPSPTSPTPTSTVAAGEIVSFVSKAEADAEALLRVQLQLDCIYCNIQVDPKCPPNDFTITELPIPVEELDDSWSLDATLGAPAGLFCSPNYQDAQNIAESIANVPIPPVDPPGDCTYGNIPITASCIGDPAEGTIIVRRTTNPIGRGGPCVGGQDGPDTSPYILPTYIPEEGALHISLFEPFYRQYISSQSYPNPWAAEEAARNITIARNTFIVTEGLVPLDYAPGVGNRAQLYANELAGAMAVSTLDCFFSNCPGNYLCHGNINNNSYEAVLTGTQNGVPRYGTSSAYPAIGYGGARGYPVSPKSYGSSQRPLFIQEGQFISYVGPWEVQAALNGFLLGVLDCFWENTGKTALCGAELTVNGVNYTYNPGSGQLDYAISNPCLDEQKEGNPNSGPSDVHPVSKGAPGNGVSVEAGIFRSYLHPNIPEIEAAQLAIGQLFCFYTNSEVTKGCFDTLDPSVRGEDIPLEGAEVEKTVCADVHFSAISQALADSAAEVAAKAALTCLWASRYVYIEGSGAGGGGGGGGEEAVPDPCSPDDIRVGPDALDAGAAISPVNTDGATDIAAAMLSGMQSCLDPEDFGGGNGNDGAQTGCDGECYGYFS